MRSWLMLVSNGQGSAHEVDVFPALGPAAADETQLRVESARLNSHVDGEAAMSVQAGGCLALRLLNNAFRGQWRPISLECLEVRTDLGVGDIRGLSGGLLFAMLAFIKLAQRDRLFAVPDASFAATGEIDRLGNVVGVEGVPAKIAAALAVIPAGGVILFPRDNEAEVGQALRDEAVVRRIRLASVERIEEALDRLGVSVKGWWKDSPYRALATYEVEDGPIYFGRQGETDEFMQLLLKREQESKTESPARPGGIVVAASGAGKSSFVRAGLLARLRSLPAAGHPPVEYAIWQPRNAFFGAPMSIEVDALVASVLGNWSLNQGAASTGFGGMAAAGEPSSLADLAEALAQTGLQGRRLVWVVDQLEELFSLPFSDEARIAFARFLGCLQAHGVWVVATMRSEFVTAYLKLADAHGRCLLAEVFGKNFYSLKGMAEEALDDAIRRPAEVAGVRFAVRKSDGIGLDQVIRAAALGAQSMPLLGYALNELWKRRVSPVRADFVHGRSPEMTFEAYADIGGSVEDGIKRVIGQVAEATYAAGWNGNDVELKRLLEALAVPMADSDRETSRPADLALWRPGSPGRQLVDALVAERLLISEEAPDGKSAQLRVVHEALFEHWDKAKTLLTSSRQTRLAIEVISARAKKWQKSERRDELLTSAADLQIARETRSALTAEHHAERSGHPPRATVLRYIDLSLKAYRRRRQFRLWSGATGAAVLIALASSIRSEQEQEERARQQSAARSLLEAVQRVEAGDPLNGVIAALSSMHERSDVAPSPGEEAVLLRALLMMRPPLALPSQTDPAPDVGEVSLDGQRLLTASRDGNVRVAPIGNAGGGQVLRHEEALTFAGFSDATGQVLTTTANRLRVWSRAGAVVIERAKDPTENVVQINTTKGHVLLSSPRSARVLELATGREKVLPTLAWVKSASFDESGARVLLSHADGTAMLWQLDRPRPLAVKLGSSPDGAPGEQALISPDGRWLAVGFSDRSIQLCHIPGGRLRCHALHVARPDQMSAPVPRIADRHVRLIFSPDSSRLYALIHTPLKPAPEELELGESGLGVWALDGTREPELLGMMGLQRQPTQIALSRLGDRVVVAGQGHIVQVVDLTMPVWEVSDVVVFPADKVVMKMFNGPKAGELSFLASDGQITSWDPEPRYPRRLLVDPTGERIDAFLFSSDSQKVSTSVRSLPTRIDEWGISRRQSGQPSTDSLTGLSLNKVATSASATQRSDRMFERQPTCWGPGPVSAFSRGPLVARVATRIGASLNAILTVKLPTGEERSLEHSAAVRCMAASADSRYIATADASHIIYLWDMETRVKQGNPDQADPTMRLIGHRNRVTDLAFSPDARRLLSSSEDATARLWMLGGDTPASVTLDGHNGTVLFSTFAPSGDLVGTLSVDGNLRLWETPSGNSLVQLARSAAAR